MHIFRTGYWKTTLNLNWFIHAISNKGRKASESLRIANTVTVKLLDPSKHVLSNKDIFNSNKIFSYFADGRIPVDPTTNLPIIPPNSSLSFRLPNALWFDKIERLYFDNIWANNKNLSLPAIITVFANYLHCENL